MKIEEALEEMIITGKAPKCIEDIGLSFTLTSKEEGKTKATLTYERADRYLTVKVPLNMGEKIKQYRALKKSIYNAIIVDYKEKD